MTRRILAISVLLVIALITAAGAASPPPQAVTISQLRQKIQDLRSDKSDLQDQVDAQNQAISDQADTIQRLRTRIANQPDPLDAITSRGPDGLWSAMRAIWLAFPTLDPSQICGYDKSNAPGGDGLTVTIFSFEKWSGCE